jgi:hypothetical protein
MSRVSPMLPQRKAKPFTQANLSALPNLKVRKQQGAQTADKSLEGPYNLLFGDFHITKSNKISKRSYDK